MTASSPRGGARIVKVTPDVKSVVLEFVTNDSTLTIKELKRLIIMRTGMVLSISTIFRMLESSYYSFKRLVLSPIARNTSEAVDARYNYAVEFTNLQDVFSDEEFIFVDEVGFFLSTRRSMRRSLVGTPAVKRVTSIRTRNLSICVGMNVGGEYFKLISKTPYNKDLFCRFLQKFLSHLY
jgi:hypothetical protein